VDGVTGQIVFKIDYEPNGGAVLSPLPGFDDGSGVTVTTFGPRYPGQYAEGAYPNYNWHRSYSTLYGLYLQPEPVMQDPSFVVGYAAAGVPLNAYGYAANNPQMYVDWDGMKPIRNAADIAERMGELKGSLATWVMAMGSWGIARWLNEAARAGLGMRALPLLPHATHSACDGYQEFAQWYLEHDPMFDKEDVVITHHEAIQPIWGTHTLINVVFLAEDGAIGWATVDPTSFPAMPIGGGYTVVSPDAQGGYSVATNHGTFWPQVFW
jgi:RHS repeat-associated protein